MVVSHTVGDSGYWTYFQDVAAAEGYALGEAIGENPRGRPSVGKYLSEGGSAEGKWMGKHAATMGLSGGVTEKEASILFQLGQDPRTLQPLGKKPAQYVTLDALTAAKMVELKEAGKLTGLSRTELNARRRAERDIIQLADPKKRPEAVQNRTATTCIDYTLSVTKSVSALYAMYMAAGEYDKAAEVLAAFEMACARTIKRFEENHAKTRTGGTGGAAVAQVDVEAGVIAVGYLHTTSRPAKGAPSAPHLHKHVIISSRVRKWDAASNSYKYLALDTGASRDARKELSGYMDLAVIQELGKLGYKFVTGRDQLAKPLSERNQELEFLDNPEFIAALSPRTEQIHASAKKDLEQFVTDHGRQPTPGEERTITQRHTVKTRENKRHDQVAELDMVRDVARRFLGKDWAQRLGGIATGAVAKIDPASITFAQRGSLAAGVIAELEAAGGVAWTRSTIQSHVIKTIGNTYGAALTANETDTLIAELTAMAAGEYSIACSGYQAVEDQIGGHIGRRADGSSVFIRDGAQLYTSESVISKEADLLRWAKDVDPAWQITLRSFERANAECAGERGYALAGDQYEAARALATSGRSVDTMTGPAGVGKTTTLRPLVRAAQYDGRKVFGLCLAQKAADTLRIEAGLDACYNTAAFEAMIGRGPLKATRAKELAAATAATAKAKDAVGAAAEGEARNAALLKLRNAERAERTAKGLHEWAEANSLEWERGGLYIVDEAGSVSLPTLHSLVLNARLHGASVILAGDPHQIGTVKGAGGTLKLLSEQVPGAELRSVWRFTKQDAVTGKTINDEAYAALTLRIRNGDIGAAQEMMRRGMVKFGTAEAMMDAAVAAWEEDLRNGVEAVIPVRSNAERTEMALRGCEAMREGGHLGADTGWKLGDGTPLHIGSLIMARKNDHKLRFAPDGNSTDRGQMVANRHTFRVTGSNPVTGAVTAKSTIHGKSMTFPRSYWAGEYGEEGEEKNPNMESSIAVTGMGVQGQTVESSHAVLTSTSTRADLYVTATRGRKATRLYLVTDELDPTGETASAQFASPEAMLERIIRRDTTELSLTEQVENDWKFEASLPVIAERHEHYRKAAVLGARKGAERIVKDIMGAEAASVLGAEAWTTLADLIVCLHGQDGVDIAAEIRGSLDRAGLAGARDAAAVLHARLGGQERQAAAGRAARAASVTIPWQVTPETGVAANSDEAAAMRLYDMEGVQRATYLGDHAIREEAPWLAELGPEPGERAPRARWMATVTAVAAYRENYNVPLDERGLFGVPGRVLTKTEVAAQVRITETVKQYHAAGRPDMSMAEEELIMAAATQRTSSFPGRAYTAGGGGPAAPESYPKAEAAAVPEDWRARTWGGLSDDDLRKKYRGLLTDNAQQVTSIKRLEAEVGDEGKAAHAAQREVDANESQALAALLAKAAQLTAKVAKQAEVVGARARLAEARAAADVETERVTRATKSRFARNQVDARSEQARCLAEVRAIDARLAQLQREAGPDALWHKVDEARAELLDHWQGLHEVAKGTDQSIVERHRQGATRARAVLKTVRGQLNATRAQISLVVDESKLRGAQSDRARATEAKERANEQRASAAAGKVPTVLAAHDTDYDYMIEEPGYDVTAAPEVSL